MQASAKVAFGTAKHSPIKNVRYVSREDAFDVEFDDGLCILEPHYANGQIAEVSWSFIRELPPKK
jgi:hypothetical protein